MWDVSGLIIRILQTREDIYGWQTLFWKRLIYLDFFFFFPGDCCVPTVKQICSMISSEIIFFFFIVYGAFLQKRNKQNTVYVLYEKLIL